MRISIHRLDLAGYRKDDLVPDLVAAISATFLTVPQVVAHAMIAGLPPAWPAMLGALFRSSWFVVTGPTNALSLLVGTAIASAGGADPVQTGIMLALLVGVMQWSPIHQGPRNSKIGGTLVGTLARPLDEAIYLGVGDRSGRANLFPTEPGWFAAMDHALDRA